jgi:choline dehydrogenase-like flavoprotein
VTDPSSIGQILTAADLISKGAGRALSERVDVCIVGSGAGGAVVAALLAEKGARVLVVEEGSHLTSKDFKMEEGIAYPQLYQDGGQRATSDLSIAILQGRALGGGTVVNWTTSSRIPDRILAHWQAVHGVDGFGPAELAPHFAAVEQRLRVHEQPFDELNANNRVLWDGAGKLGLSRAVTKRAVENCANLGYCGMGCPIDAKTSVDHTYVRDAIEKGARFFTQTRALRVETKGRRATVVHARVLDPKGDLATGPLVAIKAKLVVLAGGAINTPALLLRSEIGGGGLVGKRTFLNPTLASIALFRERVDGFKGAPQSVESYHHAERGRGRVGFIMEAAAVHPMFTALVAGGLGAEHQGVMAKLGNASVLIARCIDGLLPEEQGGTVSLGSDGRVQVDYPIRPEIWESLREASRVLARIQLAAGAERAISPQNPPVLMLSEGDTAKLDTAPWEAGRTNLFSNHPVGGCAMGRKREKSVVDSNMKMHELENVYVVDGSVFPTSPGVGPQEGILALAHWAVDKIAAAIR